MNAYLEGLYGEHAGRRYQINSPILSIGRDESNTIVIRSRSVTRRHAELRRDADGVTVVDLGSRNGIYVNRVRLEAPRRLQPGDQITIAKEVFVFAEESAVAHAGAAVLFIRTGALAGQRVTIDESGVTIGRKATNSLQLAGANISRHHAEIRPGSSGFILIDHGSRNGTLVNGKALAAPQLLRPGDEITIGETVLVFESSSNDAVTELDTGTQLIGRPNADKETPRERGVRCPGRCGRVYPFGVEHCPLDGSLLVNGHTALADIE